VQPPQETPLALGWDTCPQKRGHNQKMSDRDWSQEGKQFGASQLFSLSHPLPWLPQTMPLLGTLLLGTLTFLTVSICRSNPSAPSGLPGPSTLRPSLCGPLATGTLKSCHFLPGGGGVPILGVARRTHLSETFSEPTNKLLLRRPARVPRKAMSTPGSDSL
jgi:hypothetical protein